MTLTDVEEVIDTHYDHVNSGMARLMRLLNVGVEQTAEGAYVEDHNGVRYLDCGGYCVFLLGRRHPRVLQAAYAQLEHIALGSRLLVNRQQADAAKALAAIAPAGLRYVWLANSGAEAVEAAIKLAKLNGRTRFIAMEGGFHGKTLGALSLTHNPKYRTPFLPLLPDVTFVPFGDAAALADALGKHAADAAVVMEPLQSEAGVIIPPMGYLSEVARLCDERGSLLVMDEISTGLGRTGAWWYCQEEGVTPDILLCGKALSGGLVPVSALMCGPALYEAFNCNPLVHTSTFAGSPLVSAVVKATIDTLSELDAPQRARRLGDRILNGLIAAQQRWQFPFVRDIRGRGLLMALEFSDDAFAGEFLLEMVAHRVLISHSLNAHATARLTPPLTLNDTDVSLLLAAVESSLTAIHKRYFETQGHRS
ncbi:putrescine aminotransferase [Tahibacter aquaticus]|uniref:Putrescine aminotransferase n=1 Tax=Tahibacter aquaticus TaxID=520092 RepID=A0A4R6Z2D5_9GAMM|nr:aminotransferase class III-fold pyridoxal phosphate-dependent enzyme [Tahibacter aquaticus]TDR45629.1 putrescine aminotransferase [Tahibacter aquaticus]